MIARIASRLDRSVRDDVESLQARIDALEAKLRSLSVCALCSQPLNIEKHDSPGDKSSPDDGDEVQEQPTTEDGITQTDLISQFRQFSLKLPRFQLYFGPSSTFAFARNAMLVKEKLLGNAAQPESPSLMVLWNFHSWEHEAYFHHQPCYVYPPPDLIDNLVKIYWTYIHPTFPMLHRPTFEAHVADGLYLSDDKFGALLLSVLALSAQYSSDPRVMDNCHAEVTVGWNYIAQIQVDQSFSATLFEVQSYALIVLFCVGSSASHSAWGYLVRVSLLAVRTGLTLPKGLGIRLLQQRGNHFQKRDPDNLNAEFESWNRTFWFFDVDLPLEVDDEYWDQGFTQPVEKPSLLSFLVHSVRLSEILGDTLRRLYASKKAKILLGWKSAEWEQQVVAELDSQINGWLASLPSFLRWDSQNPPESHSLFVQAAILNADYHHAQIMIHRPFIQKDNVLAAPSLSICVNAAHSMLNIADFWIKRKYMNIPSLKLNTSVFIAATVLVLRMYGQRRAGQSIAKDLAYLDIASRLLEIGKHRQGRSQSILRLYQLLLSLVNAAWEDTAHRPSPGFYPQETVVNSGPADQQRPEEGPLTSPIIPLHAEVPVDMSLDDEYMSLWMSAPVNFVSS
ncbi:unnamed protein product [Mycena citricolor]|uniref:Xylanolytic transcriptional activator regulatory domain-containing protein n=1 Tax=Mycena citricolor TaxID=2018698 RepID=A0AAD2H8U7_9AGAR|nr:unnamed protein product [Mycena citricolor]